MKNKSKVIPVCADMTLSKKIGKKLYVVITILTNIPIGAAELLHKAFL